MYFSQTPALISTAAILLLIAPSAFAANCIDRHGANTLELGTAQLRSNVNSICSSFWKGHTSSTVKEEHIVCKATSSSGKYKWCNIALENIAAQCGSVSMGTFDYNYDGSNEHYECDGFVGGSECHVHDVDHGDICNKKRGEEEEGQEMVKTREEKVPVAWTA